MDIKSSNVLLSACGTAKLADVGLSRMQTRTVMSDLSLVGTFAWAAPEILLGGLNCTKSVDIYRCAPTRGGKRERQGMCGWPCCCLAGSQSVPGATPLNFQLTTSPRCAVSLVRVQLWCAAV
jgi:serine/threonine protein kinase